MTEETAAPNDTVVTSVEPFRTVRAARIRTPRHPGLAKLPDNFLTCRQDHDVDLDFPDEKQRWRFYLPGRREPTDVTEMRWQCKRCRSWVTRRIREDTGDLWRPTGWKYVKGYLLKNTPDRRPLSRREARLEWVRRSLERDPIPVRQVAFIGPGGRILAEDPGVNGSGPAPADG